MPSYLGGQWVTGFNPCQVQDNIFFDNLYLTPQRHMCISGAVDKVVGSEPGGTWFDTYRKTCILIMCR